GASVLNIKDRRKLPDGLIDGFDLKCGLARAVAADKIVLAHTIGRHGVDVDAQIVELLTGSDATLGPDMAFKLRRDEFRLLGNHTLEARMVVGKTLDPGVLLSELRQHFIEPDGRADNLFGKAQCVKHFSAGLADC